MVPQLASALYRRAYVTTYFPRHVAVVASRRRQPDAHIVLLAGCQDDQTALEGDGHGRFTEELLRAWNGGRYPGSHRELIDQIRAAMPPRQQPDLFVCGAPSIVFENGRPFSPGP